MANKRKKKHSGKTKSQVTLEWLIAKGKEFSKDLRSKSTIYEKTLYRVLKDLHYNFEFQVPIICGKKHLYIVDFLLTDFNIFIEADGVSTHGTKEAIKKDNRRTKLLKKEGYYPIRFWNKQISVYTKETINQIIQQKINLLKLDKDFEKLK